MLAEVQALRIELARRANEMNKGHEAKRSAKHRTMITTIPLKRISGLARWAAGEAAAISY